VRSIWHPTPCILKSPVGAAGGNMLDEPKPICGE